MSRYYGEARRVLVPSDGFVDKIVGDQVVALYFPAYAGPKHARKAIEAGLKLLQFTGHRAGSRPWIPVGVGVHTGYVYAGLLGADEGADLTAIGEAMNLTARLSSAAAEGEVPVSDSAHRAAGLDADEPRRLSHRGRTDQPGSRSQPLNRSRGGAP